MLLWVQLDNAAHRICRFLGGKADNTATEEQITPVHRSTQLSDSSDIDPNGCRIGQEDDKLAEWNHELTIDDLKLEQRDN